MDTWAQTRTHRHGHSHGHTDRDTDLGDLAAEQLTSTGTGDRRNCCTGTVTDTQMRSRALTEGKSSTCSTHLMGTHLSPVPFPKSQSPTALHGAQHVEQGHPSHLGNVGQQRGQHPNSECHQPAPGGTAAEPRDNPFLGDAGLARLPGEPRDHRGSLPAHIREHLDRNQGPRTFLNKDIFHVPSSVRASSRRCEIGSGHGVSRAPQVRHRELLLPINPGQLRVLQPQLIF